MNQLAICIKTLQTVVLTRLATEASPAMDHDPMIIVIVVPMTACMDAMLVFITLVPRAMMIHLAFFAL